jgi:hypothetical protein
MLFLDLTYMKKIMLLFCLFIVLLTSCGEEDTVNHNIVSFKPRKCNYVWAETKYLFPTEYDGITYYTISDIELSNTDSIAVLDASTLLIKLSTGNQYHLFNNVLDSSDTYIEKQLLQSYRADETQNGYKGSGESTSLFALEYRTTGVRALSVSCLNQKLWGIEPGEELGQHFTIWQYDPTQIVTSGTKKLLFGFTDNAKSFPKTIEEWIALSPMAQPCMYLLLDSVPAEAPCPVQFVLTLSTNEGTILKDTTDRIWLNKK